LRANLFVFLLPRAIEHNMAANGASSISVTVRVRPFTIREAAQLRPSDGEPLFLGDGSMAAAPTPRLHQKGIRPVIKVMDEKCL
jgi:kinesin family protein 18/19